MTGTGVRLGNGVKGLFRNFAILSTALVLSSCASTGGEGSANKLNIGFDSTAPETVDLKPQFAGLMNLNGKATSELFMIRAKNAGFHSELLKGTYAPSPNVFQIDSKSPWWSLKGYLFRANSISPTEGVSRESPYFGNPFLLVVPEWYGTDLNWSNQRFSTPQSFADVYPAFLQPTGMKIFPKEKREEITYDVMEYFNNVKALLDGNWKISNIGFDLTAYNAEDFGYNYLYVDVANSKNMGKLPPEVIKIGQTLMVRHQDTCAPACNDIYSPDEMKGFKVNRLPAKCHLLLWADKPASHLVSPDFTVDLLFK